MNILVISQRKLFPMTDGALIYSYGLLKMLKRMGGIITLVSFTNNENYTVKELDELQKYVKEVYLCKLHWKNTAMNISIKYPNNVRKYTRRAMVKLLRSINADKKYRVVIIDHLQMYEYAKIFSQSRIILHTHNVESDIWFDYANKCKGIVRALVMRSAKMTYEYEKTAIERADCVTAISESDARKFELMVPGKKIEILHGFSEYSLVKDDDNIRNAKNRILFIGSYGWYPNVASAKYLVDKVMPILRKKKQGIQLYLVGKDPSWEMVEYGKIYDDVIVTGMVESVDPYIADCDIFVNSVCDGSGINIKMIEAMGKGIPIVTSEFGARGYNIRSGKEVYIYKTAEECAEYIEKLLNDRELALCLRNEARLFYDNFNMASENIKYVIIGDDRK